MGFFNRFRKSDSKGNEPASKTGTTNNVVGVDMQRMQSVINQMYPGIAMLVRDINLPDGFADKYVPGMIIREKGFVDASCRIGGMVTTHRYIILSNHMRNFSQFEQGTNWGLCVAPSDSRFKVLGRHIYKGKCAIILLHLPNDENWKMFKTVNVSIDQQLLEMTIQRFEEKCELPPIPELADRLWLGRCQFPVGLNDEGEPWELE